MTQPGPTTVDTAAMQTALGHFEHHYALQNQNKLNIVDEIDTLRAAYTGDVSGKLQVALDGWVLNFQNIIQQLDTMIGALGGNQQAYVAGEEVNLQVADQAAAQMTGFLDL